MSSQIHIATRKGLFRLDRNSNGWGIGCYDFEGAHVSMMLHDHRDGMTYAALNHGHFGVKLHRSNDSGENWEECAVPVYPEGAEIGADPFSTDGKPKPASLSEIWALEPGGADQPKRLWCGTIPGGLFRSDDGGTSWQLVESLWNLPERLQWFGGGKDHPGIHSICVHPKNSKHVAVSISCGGVWVTEDEGVSWHCKADGIRADYVPPDQANDPNIQDVHRLVQSPSQPDTYWAQHHNGVFRTTDGAHSWQELSGIQPSPFGFAVAVHPKQPDTAWFVPAIKDECRVPVDGQFVITRTTDGGKTSEVLTKGLPGAHSYDIVYRHALDIDGTGNCLAVGSTTGNFWISEDGGDSWQTISTNLPPIYCVRFTKT
ncbi:MAG: exo-alpha-sialidase [Planctomycetes bacterium]|nr:exo-alpha-sialidase [Planctomycetota bacterium]MCH9725050.1 exo-alpha-sialidase [Planctomycetota bacterium]MCH9779336.1 exo-alpha-sialidase [Planctomycetota bacterium]MCH9789872.1 exo-alpha-sialidase [Planctomycetota bacterium]